MGKIIAIAITPAVIVWLFIKSVDPDIKKLAIWFLASFYLALIAFTWGNTSEMVISVATSLVDMALLLVVFGFLYQSGRSFRG